MNKRILLTVGIFTCSILLSGCGTASTTDTTSPSPTPTSSWHPRCFMAPEDRPRPEEHIACPSGGDSISPSPTTTSSPESPTSITASPTTSIPPHPTFSPRTATTASDLACLNGHWKEDRNELDF